MDKNEKFSKKPPSKASKNTSEGIKRIEYRGDYVRISRTGGVAGRASVSNKKMGIGATVNTKHGATSSQTTLEWCAGWFSERPISVYWTLWKRPFKN